MKIALIGTGRMGKAIGDLATSRGHEVILKINEESRDKLTPEELSKADIAIEFTGPDAAVKNLYTCLEAGVPVVCGTTGWQKHFEEVSQRFKKENGTLMYASNYSVGVNLLFELNRIMAGWMSKRTSYLPEIAEVHHIHKLDKPSGTAVTLAEDIIRYHEGYQKWVLAAEMDKMGHNEIPIIAERETEVIGIHSVTWKSQIDKISLYHEAFTRDGFVEGVLEAVIWLDGKKGVFTMKDLLFPSNTPAID
jgi:4-hydroxy-tetrahydrodipicolinate reductase